MASDRDIVREIMSYKRPPKWNLKLGKEIAKKVANEMHKENFRKCRGESHYILMQIDSAQ